VSVVGDFNAWDGRRHPMRLRHGTGVWELFLPGLARGALYKYEIVGPQATCCRSRPTRSASRTNPPPGTASVVSGLPVRTTGTWTREVDGARGARNATGAPISIYEVHLGSWRRGEDGALLDYDELAEQLVALRRPTWASPMSSSCRSPNTPSPAPGATSRSASSRPPRRFGTPEDFARWWTGLHAPASA
jgi:1,4-alpha-glucan branching enzyme